MRTIIAGSRNIIDYSVVKNAIENSGFWITTVLSGNADGVDKLGERYANAYYIPLEVYRAEWERYGRRRAGKIRNCLMAEKADALIAVWDGESTGTKHMIEEARNRGLKVFVYIVGSLDEFIT